MLLKRTYRAQPASLLLFHDAPQGLEYQADVAPEGVVVDVFEIQLDLFLHDDFDIVPFGVFSFLHQLVLVAVLDGGGVGDAWPHVEDVHLLGSPVIDVMPHFGPWPHEAHLAAEHVDQLGELVEFELADEVAGARDARVVPANCDQTAFVGTDTHGAELEDAEIPIVSAYAHLAVEDGAGGVELDPDGED